MRSLRIGMVDLDTSHPKSWLPILRELGHEVVAVTDGGTVHPAGYAERFASDHGIARVYASPQEMAADARLDAVIVHSCNWDLHIERAAPFIEANIGVLLDKPLAGNPRDIRTLLEWAERGARISGGSSLRYCREVAEWRSSHDEKEISLVTAGCGVDEFHYGIHAYSLLCGIVGPGLDGVRYLGERGQRHIELVWSDGRRGILVVGRAEGPLPFHAAIVTDRDVAAIQAASQHLYRALLAAALPYLSGDAPAPVPLRHLVESELAAIAAEASRLKGGAYVRLADLTDDDRGYDGHAFSKIYRKQRIGH
jgi:hypothetical protein